MKIFFNKLLKFLAVLVAYMIFCLIFNLVSIYSMKLPFSHVNVLIAGDSQIGKALNPEFIQSSENIAQNAESYVITYWKLKYVLAHAEVDTIILGFGHHSLSTFNELKLKHDRWASTIFKRIYPIVDMDELSKVDVDTTAYLRTLFTSMCLYPSFNHAKFMEEYENIRGTKLDNLESLDIHYNFEQQKQTISRQSIIYLDSIIYLCHSKKIELILLGSPVHKSYYDSIPEVFISSYEGEKETHEELGLRVLDYTKYDMPDSLFRDVNHLNAGGAALFSRQIEKVIRKK